MEKLMKAQKTIGTKQTLKAIEKGIVEIVYIAKDAEHKVTNPVADFCKQKNITVEYVDTMAELGNACGIDVGAATAAILRK